MEVRSVEAIVGRLNQAGARYLVVGGLAVVAHGYMRLTVDFDLILDLGNEENLRLALEALSSEGYQPRAPVPLSQFADAATRRRWIEEKGLVVFSLWSEKHRRTEIDLFVENPLDFESAYARSVVKISDNNVATRIIAREDLIDLKRQANRPKDLIDIEYLERLPPEIL